MKGDRYLAWSSDEEILKRADCGGVVTSLLKFALETKRVDAVVAIKARDGNRYDGIPVLISDPQVWWASLVISGELSSWSRGSRSIWIICSLWV